MSTEAWWRNPRLYIRELVECASPNIIFDKGCMVKYRIKPLEFVHAHYSTMLPYRLIILDQETAAEYTHEGGPDKPIASWPVWHYGDEQGLLEELLMDPVGQDKELCFDTDTPIAERPVYGQEHRVIIDGLPDGKTGVARRFMVYLKDLQETFPEAIIHLHGAYSWRVAFGQGLRAADVQPREWAAHGQVALPGGSVVRHEKLQAHASWVTAMGFTPGDLASPRNRCMYNIKSGEWAAKHFTELTQFQPAKPKRRAVDDASPDSEYVAKGRQRILDRGVSPQAGDKQLCSMCSLSNSCSYFRDGSVCTLPDAETTPLANYFKTRDSATIIEGLGTLLSFQARRLERGAQVEEALGDLDPEVTKLANTVFDQAVKMAKLVDPALRSAPVKINLNQGPGSQALVAASTPQELTGAIVRELELKGVPRDKITPAMITGMLEGMTNPDAKTRAIEGYAVDGPTDERR